LNNVKDDTDHDQIDSGSKPKQAFNIKEFTEGITDVNRDLRHFSGLKAAEGVTFVAYDQYGFKIDPESKGDKEDIRKYLAKEGDDVGFEYVPPNDEQMAKVL